MRRLYLIAPPDLRNVFEACLKSVRTEWTCHRHVWHTSNSAGGKNWISSSVLMCNLMQSGCIHPRPASFPPFVHTILGRFNRVLLQASLLVKGWNSCSCNQTRVKCVSHESELSSELSSLPCHMPSGGPRRFHPWTWGHMHTLHAHRTWAAPRMHPGFKNNFLALIAILKHLCLIKLQNM